MDCKSNTMGERKVFTVVNLKLWVQIMLSIKKNIDSMKVRNKI